MRRPSSYLTYIYARPCARYSAIHWAKAPSPWHSGGVFDGLRSGISGTRGYAGSPCQCIFLYIWQLCFCGLPSNLSLCTLWLRHVFFLSRHSNLTEPPTYLNTFFQANFSSPICLLPLGVFRRSFPIIRHICVCFQGRFHCTIQTRCDCVRFQGRCLHGEALGADGWMANVQGRLVDDQRSPSLWGPRPQPRTGEVHRDPKPDLHRGPLDTWGPNNL